jgi:hypothetical protein
MVMEMLGPSLEYLVSEKLEKSGKNDNIVEKLGKVNKNNININNYFGKGFSLKTTIMLADQLISRLEYLHNKDYVFF